MPKPLFFAYAISAAALLLAQQETRIAAGSSADSAMTLTSNFTKASVPDRSGAFKYTLAYTGIVQSARPLVAFEIKVIATTEAGKQMTWVRRDFNFTTAIDVKRPAGLQEGVPFNPPAIGERFPGKFNVVSPEVITNAVAALSWAVDLDGRVFGDPAEAQARFFSKEAEAAAVLERYLIELRSIGTENVSEALSALQARYPDRPAQFRIAEARIGLDLYNGLNNVRGGLSATGVVDGLISSASKQLSIAKRYSLSN